MLTKNINIYFFQNSKRTGQTMLCGGPLATNGSPDPSTHWTSMESTPTPPFISLQCTNPSESSCQTSVSLTARSTSPLIPSAPLFSFAKVLVSSIFVLSPSLSKSVKQMISGFDSRLNWLASLETTMDRLELRKLASYLLVFLVTICQICLAAVRNLLSLRWDKPKLYFLQHHSQSQ